MINAPTIVRFDDLGHDWRRIARTEGGKTTWDGDLTNIAVRHIYRHMLDVHVVHTVHVPDGEGRLILAAIRRAFNPRVEHWRAQERTRRPLSHLGDAI